MKSIELTAYAKVNLSLDVTGVREDGYHLMDMVNLSASLSDRLLLRKAALGGFGITSNLRYIPTGEKNLIWKAASLLSEAAGEPMPRVRCELRKVLPTPAGLGGGSADAAAALIGLNELMGYGLSRKDLAAVGEKVGADVPYCLTGGPARVTGTGEEIRPVKDNCSYRLVIVMPGRGRSTPEAFAALDSGRPYAHPDTEKVLEGLAEGDLEKVAANARNVVEEAAPDERTASVKEKLLSLGGAFASLTGTGAAVFGLYPDPEAAARACAALRGEGFSAWEAAPVKRGVRIQR